MLSEWQEAAIAHVAISAAFGLSIGTVCGGLVGTIVCLLRTRRASAVLLGPFLSIVPSAVAAGLAGMLAALALVSYYPLNSGGEFDIADHSFMMWITLVLVVSAMVAILAPREGDEATGHGRKTIWWTIIWAVIGGVVWAAASFDHWELVRLTTIGHALLGAIVVGGWRFLAELVVRKFASQLAPYERKPSHAAAAGESPWDREDDA